MAVLEAVAGLVFISVILASVIAIVIVVPKLIASWKWKHSPEGRIAAKQQELDEQDAYLDTLTREIADSKTREARKATLSTYRELALEQRKQLALQLESLKDEHDTEEFEQRMQRRQR